MEPTFSPEQPWVSLPTLQQDLGNTSERTSRGHRPPSVATPPQDGRIPPQALEVEQSVLGAMLIEPEAIPEAIELLQEKSFYDPRHRFIFKAIAGLFERNVPVDIITLTEELRRIGQLEVVGGGYYISELSTRVASAANVGHHARIVAEKSLLRQMIETMTGVIQKAFDPATDAFELMDSAEQAIFQISQNQLRNAAQPMNAVVRKVMEHLEAIHGQEGGITGVPSGFSALDAMTSGWQNSDLIIVAARPSMGKTAFALSLVRNAALSPRNPVPVAIFSLEMSAAQLATRLLTAEARIDAQSARMGKLSEEAWMELPRAAGRLSEAPIFIDDTPGLGILELRAKCRRLKAEHNIGLVVVDYLQLMHGGKGNNSREQEIAQISRSMKILAKELEIPVIALSQLSRAVETRGGDKKPQLSDLRESGSIEQDADMVLFIYRPEKYGIPVDESGQSTEGVAEILISKQRNGPIGTAKLAFVDRFARFENLAHYYNPDEYIPPVSGSGDGYDAYLPPSSYDAPF